MRLLTFCAMVGAWAGPAVAGTLDVRVTDAAGRPVADAVVIVRAVGRATPLPRRTNALKVEQRDLQFHPFVTIVPVGSSVSFPNFDKTRHHVYSFSAPKKFELKLFASEQSRSVTFDKAGVVAIGCNIHDQMAAFLYVSDSAWTARSDARGVASIDGLPAGAVSVSLFHPYLRAPGSVVARSMTLSGGRQTAQFAVNLRAPPPTMRHGY
ncbi:MAG: methylamine utilization protein [Sphingomicrobium sp.]